MQKKARIHEFTVIEEFNLYQKPSFLSWEQFWKELSSFHLTFQFPSTSADSSRFTLHSHPPSTTQQPQTQQPQAQQQQTKKKTKAKNNKQSRGRNNHNKAESNWVDDEEPMPLTQKQREQLQRLQKEEENKAQSQLQRTQALKSKIQQEYEDEKKKKQMMRFQDGTKVVDVAITRTTDGVSDLIRSAFKLAFR